MISYIKDHALMLTGLREIEFELELVPKAGSVGANVIQATLFGLNGMGVPLIRECIRKTEWHIVDELIAMNLEINRAEALDILKYLRLRTGQIESQDFTREIEG